MDYMLELRMQDELTADRERVYAALEKPCAHCGGTRTPHWAGATRRRHSGIRLKCVSCGRVTGTPRPGTSAAPIRGRLMD
jgi:hypothetical protein